MFFFSPLRQWSGLSSIKILIILVNEGLETLTSTSIRIQNKIGAFNVAGRFQPQKCFTMGTDSINRGIGKAAQEQHTSLSLRWSIPLVLPHGILKGLYVKVAFLNLSDSFSIIADTICLHSLPWHHVSQSHYLRRKDVLLCIFPKLVFMWYFS